jgi:hypothetical protein
VVPADRLNAVTPCWNKSHSNAPPDETEIVPDVVITPTLNVVDAVGVNPDMVPESATNDELGVIDCGS